MCRIWGRLGCWGAAEALEAIFPADLVGMAFGQMRYTFLLNEAGGILDDLIICRRSETEWQIVVNGARKAHDFDYLAARAELSPQNDRALLALQGPEASGIISAFTAKLAALPFMTAMELSLGGVQ